MKYLRSISLGLILALAAQDLSFAAGGVPLSIPKELGVIRRSELPDSEALIINIQDAHASLDAQKGIAQILDHLVKHCDLSLVGLEGSEGEVDTSLVSSFPDASIRKSVAESLLGQTKISAAEFYRMVSGPKGSEVELFGSEDLPLYKANVKTMQKLILGRARTQELVGRLGGALKQLERGIFSVEIVRADELFSRYRDGEASLGEFWKGSEGFFKKSGVRMESYPNFKKLVAVSGMEAGIDFRQAEKERALLIEALREKLAPADFDKLVLKALEFKLGRLSPGQFHRSLMETAPACGIKPEGFPHLKDYVEYTAGYESIDVLSVLDEIESAERVAKRAIFSKPEERRLEHTRSIFRVLSGLLETSLSSKDYAFYLRNKVFFKDKNLRRALAGLSAGAGEVDFDFLNSQIQLADVFYAEVKARNEALLKNLVARMRQKGKKVAALVSGGFHSEGLGELMRQRRISHIVVMPKFDAGAPRPYLAVITEKGSYLDREMRRQEQENTIVFTIGLAVLSGMGLEAAKGLYLESYLRSVKSTKFGQSAEVSEKSGALRGMDSAQVNTASSALSPSSAFSVSLSPAEVRAYVARLTLQKRKGPGVIVVSDGARLVRVVRADDEKPASITVLEEKPEGSIEVPIELERQKKPESPRGMRRGRFFNSLALSGVLFLGAMSAGAESKPDQSEMKDARRTAAVKTKVAPQSQARLAPDRVSDLVRAIERPSSPLERHRAFIELADAGVKNDKVLDIAKRTVRPTYNQERKIPAALDVQFGVTTKFPGQHVDAITSNFNTNGAQTGTAVREATERWVGNVTLSTTAGTLAKFAQWAWTEARDRANTENPDEKIAAAYYLGKMAPFHSFNRIEYKWLRGMIYDPSTDVSAMALWAVGELMKYQNTGTLIGERDLAFNDVNAALKGRNEVLQLAALQALSAANDNRVDKLILQTLQNHTLSPFVYSRAAEIAGERKIASTSTELLKALSQTAVHMSSLEKHPRYDSMSRQFVEDMGRALKQIFSGRPDQVKQLEGFIRAGDIVTATGYDEAGRWYVYGLQLEASGKISDSSGVYQDIQTISQAASVEQALGAFVRLGAKKNPALVPFYVKILMSSSQSPMVKKAVLNALSQLELKDILGSMPPENLMFTALDTILKHPEIYDDDLRASAIRLLSNLGTDRVFDPLISTLARKWMENSVGDQERKKVREEAEQVLGRLSPAGYSSFMNFLKVKIRQNLLALPENRPGEYTGLAVYESLLWEFYMRQFASAAEARRSISDTASGSGEFLSTDQLIQQFRNETDASHRALIARQLGGLKNIRALRFVVGLFDGLEPTNVKIAALRAVLPSASLLTPEQVREYKILEAVEKLLEDSSKNPELRMAAIEFLASLPDARSVEMAFASASSIPWDANNPLNIDQKEVLVRALKTVSGDRSTTLKNVAAAVDTSLAKDAFSFRRHQLPLLQAWLGPSFQSEISDPVGPLGAVFRKHRVQIRFPSLGKDAGPADVSRLVKSLSYPQKLEERIRAAEVLGATRSLEALEALKTVLADSHGIGTGDDLAFRVAALRSIADLFATTPLMDLQKDADLAALEKIAADPGAYYEERAQAIRALGQASRFGGELIRVFGTLGRFDWNDAKDWEKYQALSQALVDAFAQRGAEFESRLFELLERERTPDLALLEAARRTSEIRWEEWRRRTQRVGDVNWKAAHFSFDGNSPYAGGIFNPDRDQQMEAIRKAEANDVLHSVRRTLASEKFRKVDSELRQPGLSRFHFLLADPDENTRAFAAMKLGEYLSTPQGKDDAVAIAALREGARREKSSLVLGAIAEAYGHTRGPANIDRSGWFDPEWPTLEKLSSGGNVDQKARALLALGHSADPAVASAIEHVLKKEAAVPDWVLMHAFRAAADLSSRQVNQDLFEAILKWLRDNPPHHSLKPSLTQQAALETLDGMVRQDRGKVYLNILLAERRPLQTPELSYSKFVVTPLLKIYDPSGRYGLNFFQEIKWFYDKRRPYVGLMAAVGLVAVFLLFAWWQKRKVRLGTIAAAKRIKDEVEKHRALYLGPEQKGPEQNGARLAFLRSKSLNLRVETSVIIDENGHLREKEILLEWGLRFPMWYQQIASQGETNVDLTEVCSFLRLEERIRQWERFEAEALISDEALDSIMSLFLQIYAANRLHSVEELDPQAYNIEKINFILSLAERMKTLLERERQKHDHSLLESHGKSAEWISKMRLLLTDSAVMLNMIGYFRLIRRSHTLLKRVRKYWDYDFLPTSFVRWIYGYENMLSQARLELPHLLFEAYYRYGNSILPDSYSERRSEDLTGETSRAVETILSGRPKDEHELNEKIRRAALRVFTLFVPGAVLLWAYLVGSHEWAVYGLLGAVVAVVVHQWSGRTGIPKEDADFQSSMQELGRDREALDEIWGAPLTQNTAAVNFFAALSEMEIMAKKIQADPKNPQLPNVILVSVSNDAQREKLEQLLNGHPLLNSRPIPVFYIYDHYPVQSSFLAEIRALSFIYENESFSDLIRMLLRDDLVRSKNPHLSDYLNAAPFGEELKPVIFYAGGTGNHLDEELPIRPLKGVSRPGHSPNRVDLALAEAILSSLRYRQGPVVLMSFLNRARIASTPGAFQGHFVSLQIVSPRQVVRGEHAAVVLDPGHLWFQKLLKSPRDTGQLFEEMGKIQPSVTPYASFTRDMPDSPQIPVMSGHEGIPLKEPHLRFFHKMHRMLEELENRPGFRMLDVLETIRDSVGLSSEKFRLVLMTLAGLENGQTPGGYLGVIKETVLRSEKARGDKELRIQVRDFFSGVEEVLDAYGAEKEALRIRGVVTGASRGFFSEGAVKNFADVVRGKAPLYRVPLPPAKQGARLARTSQARSVFVMINVKGLVEREIRRNLDVIEGLKQRYPSHRFEVKLIAGRETRREDFLEKKDARDIVVFVDKTGVETASVIERAIHESGVASFKDDLRHFLSGDISDRLDFLIQANQLGEVLKALPEEFRYRTLFGLLGELSRNDIHTLEALKPYFSPSDYLLAPEEIARGGDSMRYLVITRSLIEGETIPISLQVKLLKAQYQKRLQVVYLGKDSVDPREEVRRWVQEGRLEEGSIDEIVWHPGPTIAASDALADLKATIGKKEVEASLVVLAGRSDFVKDAVFVRNPKAAVLEVTGDHPSAWILATVMRLAQEGSFVFFEPPRRVDWAEIAKIARNRQESLKSA